MSNIEDLQPYKPATITLTIQKLDEVREFEKFGKSGKVRNATAKDSKGKEITLTLWNDETDIFKEGDIVRIDNGWVSEYQGNLQISSGKYGKLQIQAQSDEPLQDHDAVEEEQI